MSFINDFDEEFMSLLPYCEEQISCYPEPFKSIGLENLRKHDVTKSKRTSYICYLLSFWLKDVFGVHVELCKKVSTGFIFGMIYFFIQDDIIDSDVCENRGEKLLLANLIMSDFIKEYQKLFNSESMFWHSFRKHITEWAEFNNWELTQHRNKFADYSKEDLFKLAGKAAPIKIINEALGILSGKEELIDMVNEATDILLVSMQMVDDLGDWKKDMLDGNCTYLLTEAMKYNNITELTALSETHVRKALYFGALIEKLIAIIDENGRRLDNIPIDIIYLRRFNQLLRDDCQNALNKIYERKMSFLEGGLSNILRKSEVDSSNAKQN